MNQQQTYQKSFIIGVIIILFGVLGYFLLKQVELQKTVATFSCRDNKSIIATFYPKEDKEVHLVLSDGRTLSLPHVISGSGARYALTDESIVFWNKGTTAFITEGSSTTYIDCDTQIQAVETTTPTPAPTGNTTTGATLTPDGLAGYANSEYGFTMRFPKNIQTRNDFTTFYTLPSNWRLNAQLYNQGKAIVSFPIFKVDQGGVATGKAYPLFYTAEVRVGVSPDVSNCYDTDPGYTNQKITDVIINGITFKKFDSQDAGMMKYTEAASYRTVHNNICYVLEQVKSGSSYRDETMTPGLSQATLDSYYAIGETIIKTFKFTQ
jgi:membrane-bound inhibitor of C-type lysozyme